jgi:hypothetical protein
MSNETSVNAHAQYPIPTPFTRKARTLRRRNSQTAESESTRAESGRQEIFKKCSSPQYSSSRAQYNRLIGETNREEATASFKSDLSKDLARFEELFLQLSEDSDQ